MIRFGTGTYNVRDTEDIQPEMSNQNNINLTLNSLNKPPSSTLKCTVFFLDDTEHDFFISVSSFFEVLKMEILLYLLLIGFTY